MANSRSKSEPQKCRNGCGMFIYFDFVNPEGKTATGKWKPLVYYQEDDLYSGEGHDCPKSDYNQKRQGSASSSSEQQPQPQGQSRYETSYLIPHEDWEFVKASMIRITNQLEMFAKLYGDMLDNQKAISETVHQTKTYLFENQKAAESEEEFDKVKEEGRDFS